MYFEAPHTDGVTSANNTPTVVLYLATAMLVYMTLVPSSIGKLASFATSIFKVL